MATNQTEIYKLNQWVKEDHVLMEDFNADNQKLEAALKELSTRARVVHATYTGTGTYGQSNPTRLDFAATLGTAPKFLYVTEKDASYSLLLVKGMTIQKPFYNASNEPELCYVEWTETGVRWYNTSRNTYQLNISGEVYYYIAIG